MRSANLIMLLPLVAIGWSKAGQAQTTEQGCTQSDPRIGQVSSIDPGDQMQVSRRGKLVVLSEGAPVCRNDVTTPMPSSTIGINLDGEELDRLIAPGESFNFSENIAPVLKQLRSAGSGTATLDEDAVPSLQSARPRIPQRRAQNSSSSFLDRAIAGAVLGAMLGPIDPDATSESSDRKIFGSAIAGAVRKNRRGFLSNLGQVAGQIDFGSAELTANRKTCLPRAYAERIASGDILEVSGFAISSTGDDYVCTDVDIDGVSRGSTELVIPLIADAFIGANDPSEEFAFTSSSRRERVYRFKVSELDVLDVEMDLTTIDRLHIPGEEVALVIPEAPYRLVVTSSRLNLRKGPGTVFPVSGYLESSSVTEIIGTLESVGEKQGCKSKTWALISASGVGVGYACTDYLRPIEEVSVSGSELITITAPVMYPGTTPSAEELTFQRARVLAQAPCRTFSTARVRRNGVETKERVNTVCRTGGASIGFNLETASRSSPDVSE